MHWRKGMAIPRHDRPTTQLPSTECAEQAPTDFAPLNGAQTEQSGAGPIQEPPRPGGEVQSASILATKLFEEAETAAASGNQDLAVERYLACAATAEMAREWYLAAQACERVGDFLLEPRPPTDLNRALRTYRRAAMAYENCGMFAESRELFYRVSLLRLRRGAELELPPLHRAELFLYWASAGFGYRPLRVIATAMVVIVVYGFIYWLIDGASLGGSGTAVTLIDALYFSGTTFATVGYGDFIPAPHARLLAMTEGFVGAFLIGFFVVVLAHRLARS